MRSSMYGRGERGERGEGRGGEGGEGREEEVRRGRGKWIGRQVNDKLNSKLQ